MTTNDPLEVIEDACYLLFRFGLRASTTVTGNLKASEDGFYLVAVAEASSYHPLEAVMHCQDVLSGDWRTDVATRLGVSAAWVDGFVAGFSQTGEDSTGQDQEFTQGYLAAEELRQRRPRLPMEGGA